MLTVRKAGMDDVADMVRIFGHARAFMRRNGNHSQWSDSYPGRDEALSDIAAGNAYVVVAAGRTVGTFAFIVGDDPTYSVIDGHWLSDAPYGTIHRIASDGTCRGVADAALGFCRPLADSIRIDTHADNTPMRRWIESRGFLYCGIVTVADGTPRLAYQLV